jgi:hypothetical protein
MPPEQWQTNSLDAKVDVYALGCMLYLFLAGRVPFVAGNSAGLQILHQIETPKSLLEFDATLAPELVAICERMLEKNPAQRPSMEVVRDELSKLLGLDAPHPARKLRTSKEISAVPAPKGSGSGDSLPNTTSALTVDATGGASSSGLTVDVPSGSGGAVLEKSTPVLAAPPARAPAAGEQTSGLGSRATGQQLPGAVSDDARTRRRLGYAVAALLGVSVLLTVGILKWQQRPSQAPAAMTLASAVIPAQADAATTVAATKAQQASTAAPPPKPEPTTTPADAAPMAAAQPIDMQQKPSKASKSCIASEPSAACITSAVSPDMRKNILAALRDADVKLCPGDRLAVTGVEATLKVSHAPKSVPTSIQKDLVFSLRSHLHGIALPGEVEIKCKR